jgi:hypothetical protein
LDGGLNRIIFRGESTIRIVPGHSHFDQFSFHSNAQYDGETELLRMKGVFVSKKVASCRASEARATVEARADFPVGQSIRPANL